MKNIIIHTECAGLSRKGVECIRSTSINTLKDEVDNLKSELDHLKSKQNNVIEPDPEKEAVL